MPPNQTSIVTRAQRPNQLIMVLGDREHTTKRVLRPRWNARPPASLMNG
jgi:hypothetical protein